MKDLKEFWSYIVKNKYVIICVSIVVILYAFGVIGFITKFVVLILLVALAIYIGKKLQDNNDIIKKIFNFKGFKKEDNTYYYYDDNKKK